MIDRNEVGIKGLQLDNVRGIGACRKQNVSEGSVVSLMQRSGAGACRLSQKIEGSEAPEGCLRNEMGARRADSAEFYYYLLKP